MMIHNLEYLNEYLEYLNIDKKENRKIIIINYYLYCLVYDWREKYGIIV